MQMRVAALAGALTLLTSMAHADVSDYLGKPVTSVRLESENREVVDPALLQMVETRVGAPLSMLDVRESVTHLFSFGRFEDVRVSATTGESGISLLYDLVPIHPIDRISFTGAAGIDTGALRRAVTDRYGSSPPIGRAGDLALLVPEELRREGYTHAVITLKSELRHSPDRATLVFGIDAGARTRIGRVDVTGNPGVSAAVLLKRLAIVTGAPFERDALDKRIEQYVDERRSRGFLEAKLTLTTALTDEDRLVNLTLNADEGPR